jgi:PAS domain S-box-containing protein
MTGANDDPTGEQNPQGEQPTSRRESLALSGPEALSKLQAHLIELAHDAIFIRELDGRIVTWNQGAQTLYGWTEQEALGRIKQQLLHKRFPVSMEAVNQALEEEGFWEGLLQHTTRQGEKVIVESRQVLVRDETGQPTAILEINRDVTLRERLLSERIAAQARELALQETIRQMDAFLSLVSHELRTPVTSIKSMVQLMHRQAERTATTAADGAAAFAQKQSALLQRTERQMNRLTRLLDDLLDLSRIREGKLELRLEPGDLRFWVRDITEDEAASHPDRRIIFESTSDAPLPVVADADRIGQVVVNYLTNAFKYSPGERPIRVNIQRRGEQAYVEVQDEGPGIPAEEQAHVWEIFHRVPGIEVVSGSGVGLGLGLYLCKTLIERHGGQVGVESQPSQGTRFWFTLPLAVEQTAKD